MLVVRGAREHNLKSVDVSIPRGALTTITGVSGSGKSPSLRSEAVTSLRPPLGVALPGISYSPSTGERRYCHFGSRGRTASHDSSSVTQMARSSFISSSPGLFA